MHGSRLKTSGTVVLLRCRDLYTEDFHNIYFTSSDTKMIKLWNMRIYDVMQVITAAIANGSEAPQLTPVTMLSIRVNQ
jgi:hypothetical protein